MSLHPHLKIVPDEPQEPDPRPFARLSTAQLKRVKTETYDRLAHFSSSQADDDSWVLRAINAELNYRATLTRYKRRQADREAREIVAAALAERRKSRGGVA